MKNNIKKHNALTDAKTGKLSLRSDKLINALYLLYIREGESFKVSVTELRDLLELKSGKYGDDIASRLKEIRDYSIEFKNVKLSSGNYSYFVDSFIHSFGIERGARNFYEISISGKFIEAFKQKMGYTPLDLEICNKFKTKYGLKLYEMYKRYYSLPNNEGKGVGKISKSREDLNEIFGTIYKTPSEIKRGIDRGLKEIEKITGEFINCFYHKGERVFIFSWHQKEKYPKLRIPYKRIDEFIDWYLNHHEKLKISSILKYKQELKRKIIEDEFNELDKFYRGMLQWKYKLLPSEYFDVESGKYSDFKN
ncbi:MAG TPA: RepB family plasmid replication initiator protein [Bacteroidetes bacterium]|nr:RepB family plasmid replication initiator protein [Bacteroidota bacterium]